jgi:hypothetical protein
MPKAAINKDGDTLFRKRKIWRTSNAPRMHFPSRDAPANQSHSQANFRGFIPARTYTSHPRGAISFAQYIHGKNPLKTSVL